MTDDDRLLDAKLGECGMQIIHDLGHVTVRLGMAVTVVRAEAVEGAYALAGGSGLHQRQPVDGTAGVPVHQHQRRFLLALADVVHLCAVDGDEFARRRVACAMARDEAAAS